MPTRSRIRLAFFVACLAAASIQVGAPPAVAAAGGDVDWPQFHFSPAHQGFNPFEAILSSSNVSGLHEIWRGTTGDIIGLGSPAVVDGVAYIGSYDGRVYAFDAVTGALLWRAGTGQLREASVAVAHGVVYSLSANGKLSAFDAQTGAWRWTATTSALISPPTVWNGMVFVKGLEIQAFEATSGALLWSTAVDEGLASGVTIARGRLFAASGNRVYALDPNTGTILWQKLVDQFQVSMPAVSGDLLYLGDSRNGFVWALRVSNGSIAWNYDTGGLPDSTPAVANGVVYIGDYAQDAVFALDALTGTFLWRSEGGGSQGGASVANGVVYAASLFGNRVLAFDATTGETLWSSRFEDSNSTPAIVNGVLYVGADDRALHAFSL